MAECLEYIRLSSSIPLSYSRFVLIKSKINKLRNLLPFIQMGAAKRSFTASDGETWRWIVLEYGSKMVAFSEAVKLLEARSRYRTFRIDLISHQLAFLEKIERDCFQFSGPKTSVSITNSPTDITESDWVALLSEFGEDVSVERRISKGNTVVIASFNTLAEAVSVVYEMHCLEIDGTKLGVSVLKKKKELHLLDAYKKYYFQCPCLLNKRDCNRTLEEEPTEGIESERIEIPCRSSRICAFCHYPEDHSTTVEGLGIEISTLADDQFPEMKDAVSESLDLTNYWEFDECVTLSLIGNVDDILNYSGTEEYSTSDLSDY